MYGEVMSELSDSMPAPSQNRVKPLPLGPAPS